MYIVIPHQLPPRFGRDCVTGDWSCEGDCPGWRTFRAREYWKCEADCPGCQDQRDSYMCLGSPDTSPADLARMVQNYTGHQRYALRDLACSNDDLQAELVKLGVDWA